MSRFIKNIFNRNTAKNSCTELFNGFCDFHSHLLPGVDDGVQKCEDTLEILRQYEEAGVTKVIFTPHIMEDLPLNNSDFLRCEFLKFKELYRGGIELHLAAEYMIDANFNHHLESNDPLTLFDNYILIETSYLYAPMNFFETIKEVMSKGFFLVLAHPERYRYMDKTDYSTLKNMGVLFQLNLLSISGCYGEHAKAKAEMLLNENMYNLIGSDTHNLEMFEKKVLNIKLKNKTLSQLNNLKKP